MDADGWVKVIAAAAWPAVAVLVGIAAIGLLRKPLGQLLMNVKSIEYSKGKFKLVTNELKEVTQQVAEVKAQAAAKSPSEAFPLVPSTDIPALVAAAKHLTHYLDEQTLAYAEAASPAVVIDRAWRDVETQLYRLVMQEEPPTFTYLVGNDLYRQAVDEGLLDLKLLQAIGGLLNIHNETITSIMGWQPSQEQASAFVSNARDVLKLMEPYMNVGYKSKASSPKD